MRTMDPPSGPFSGLTWPLRRHGRLRHSESHRHEGVTPSQALLTSVSAGAGLPSPEAFPIPACPSGLPATVQPGALSEAGQQEEEFVEQQGRTRATVRGHVLREPPACACVCCMQAYDTKGETASRHPLTRTCMRRWRMTAPSVAITAWSTIRGSCGLRMRDRPSSMSAQIAGLPMLPISSHWHL